MKAWLPVFLVLSIPFVTSWSAVILLSTNAAIFVVFSALIAMFLLAVTFGQVMERYNNAKRESAINNDTNRIPPPDDYITSLNRAFYGGD